MSTKIYLNLLTAIIVILVFAGVFAYFYKGINNISKTLIIWYLIILILNIANIISVMKFYLANSGRKGPNGVKGDKGPRGFKGANNMCTSCGSAGLDEPVFGSFINDKGERVLSKKVKEGQCIFPFSHNYQYQYQCVKNVPPPGLTENDANMFGWCATKVDENKEPLTYAYCNANASLQEKMNKENDLRRRRKEFMENNYGILDIEVYAENTTNEARRKCEANSDYEFYERDLNEGTDGKFVHLCMKKGYGGTGITDLKVEEHRLDITPAINIFVDNRIFHLINVDLNKDSGTNKTSKNNQLFLYKEVGNKNYIKDIQVVKGSEGTCNADSGYETIFPDLNKGTTIADRDTLQLCISKQASNVMSIDSAFVFSDGNLYFFRGYNFYKMSKKPVQKTLVTQENYPKNLALKWGKIKGNDIKDCRTLDKKECYSASNCTFDESSTPPRCEQISNYDAVFTYGYDKKTYFFKGSKVFIYDDRKMKMTEDSPHNISDIFSGVPNNINSVFTWAKDNSTYFFKGPFYYKYNDKAKKVESGYPKRTNVRWENMPPLIDAIFSLPFNMEDSIGNQSTYVISGDQSWYINQSNDKLEKQKSVEERFIGLDVLLETPNPTTSSSNPTTSSSNPTTSSSD
jgi:hypothetical protein